MRAQRIKEERREKKEESSKNQRGEGNPSLREANYEELRGKGGVLITITTLLKNRW